MIAADTLGDDLMKLAYSVACKNVFDPAQVDDAASVAIVKALVVLKARPESSFGYLRGVMVNAIKDAAKRRKSVRRTLDRGLSLEGLAYHPSTDGGIGQADDRLTFEMAASALSPDEVRLCSLIGDRYSIEEISDEMSIPAGTVKSRTHRMRAKVSGAAE